MPSLDSGEPGGTLQTFFQDTVPADSSVKSATSMSVQPAQQQAAAAASKGTVQKNNTDQKLMCSRW
jgi:hypothetical protein